jgi:rare lipoprotein A (peptidoglycan hydrolase)
MKAKLLPFLGLCLLPAFGQAQTVGKQKPNSHVVKHHAKNIPLVYCDLHVCNEKPQWFGTVSYYGKYYWQGRKMANGERFDYRKLTAASWGIPLGTKVRITNMQNGKSVIVEITDRGPAHSLHRVADLSQAAAEALDYTDSGLTTAFIQPLWVFDPQPSPNETRLEEYIDPPAVINTQFSADLLSGFPEPVPPLPPVTADNKLLVENFQY